MNDYINILCATDANYAALCGVMLTSLLENNKDSNVRIFIFTQGISDVDRIKYNKLEQIYNTDVNILTIDSEVFKGCPIWPGDHLSVAAYYRLMVSDLLPDSIDKVLYLDSDIIVNGSLRQLWRQNIDNVALGAVVDANFYDEEFYQRLCIPLNSVYFNSGVLLINLKYWREHRVQERCFSCIENNRSRLRFHDQDTLNVVLYDEVKLLPISYNFQTPFLLTVLSKYYVSDVVTFDDIIKTAKNPVIIHYIGGGKPWLGKSSHPYKQHFIHYKRLSLWRSVNLEKYRDTWSVRLKWSIVNILKNLGLKSGPKTYIVRPQKVR